MGHINFVLLAISQCSFAIVAVFNVADVSRTVFKARFIEVGINIR